MKLGCSAIVIAILGSAPAYADVVTFRYDALGRLVESHSDNGGQIHRKMLVSYDRAGNRVSYDVPNQNNPLIYVPPDPDGDLVPRREQR